MHAHMCTIVLVRVLVCVRACVPGQTSDSRVHEGGTQGRICANFAFTINAGDNLSNLKAAGSVLDMTKDPCTHGGITMSVVPLLPFSPLHYLFGDRGALLLRRGRALLLQGGGALLLVDGGALLLLHGLALLLVYRLALLLHGLRALLEREREKPWVGHHMQFVDAKRPRCSPPQRSASTAARR